MDRDPSPPPGRQIRLAFRSSRFFGRSPSGPERARARARGPCGCGSGTCTLRTFRMLNDSVGEVTAVRVTRMMAGRIYTCPAVRQFTPGRIVARRKLGGRRARVSVRNLRRRLLPYPPGAIRNTGLVRRD